MKKPSSAIWPLVVLLLPFLMYFRTLCPLMFAGDSSEFAAVIQLPALAHPPGYPLYTILGYLFTRLPIGAPAFEANLFSAVMGALTCLVMYYCFMKLTTRNVVAASAAMLLGFGNIFWKDSSIAEVYTLSTLFIALSFLFMLKLGENGKSPAWHGFIFLGLMLGLGFANHQSILLIVPGIIVYFIMTKGIASPGKAIGMAVLGFLIPLILYLTLIPISNGSPSLSDPKLSGVGDLWGYVTRQAYLTRTPESIGVNYDPGDIVGPGDIAVSLIKGLWDEWGPIFFFVAIGGLVYMFFNRRRLAISIWVSITCAFLGLCFLTKGSPLGMPMIDLKVSELLPPLLPLFAFGLFAALDGSFGKLLGSEQLVGEESFIPRDKAPLVLSALYIMFPVLIMFFNLDTADMSRHTFVDYFVNNAMKGVMAPATIITFGDEYYPFRYALDVEKGYVDENGSPVELKLVKGNDIRGVEGSGAELNPDESLASFINQEINGERYVYLTLPPPVGVEALLKSAGIHLEQDGIIYEAVADSSPRAAPEGGFIRYSEPGREAEIWKEYDIDHLVQLENLKLDPLEIPYIDRYYVGSANYGALFFGRGEYELTWFFLDRALWLSGYVNRDPANIIPMLAVSGYKLRLPETPGILESAVKNGIDFPERDPYLANIYFEMNNPAWKELATNVYPEDSSRLLDFEVVEALMALDIDNKQYDAAHDKGMELARRALNLPPGAAIPEDPAELALPLIQNQKVGRALWHIASIAVMSDNIPEAKKIIGFLNSIVPSFLWDQVNLIISVGNFELAKSFCEIVSEIDPEDWRAQEGLAVCMFQLGDEDGARALAQTVIEHRPDRNNLRMILGLEPIKNEEPENTEQGSSGEAAEDNLE